MFVFCVHWLATNAQWYTVQQNFGSWDTHTMTHACTIEHIVQEERGRGDCWVWLHFLMVMGSRLWLAFRLLLPALLCSHSLEGGAQFRWVTWRISGNWIVREAMTWVTKAASLWKWCFNLQPGTSGLCWIRLQLLQPSNFLPRCAKSPAPCCALVLPNSWPAAERQSYLLSHVMASTIWALWFYRQEEWEGKVNVLCEHPIGGILSANTGLLAFRDWALVLLEVSTIWGFVTGEVTNAKIPKGHIWDFPRPYLVDKLPLLGVSIDPRCLC